MGCDAVIDDSTNVAAALRHEALRRRNMIARCRISLVDDTTKRQSLQAETFKEWFRGKIERVQQYGFTSKPFIDAEGVVLFPSGDHSHGLCIAVDDRRYRLTGLADGEVAIFDDQNQSVHLRRDGIYISSALQVVIDTPQTLITGDVAVDGEVYVQGNISSDGDVNASGISLINHTHQYTSPAHAAGPANTSASQ